MERHGGRVDVTSVPGQGTTFTLRFQKAPAVVTCPSELGIGLGTKVMFCDVLTGRDPATGIMIAIPPHRGNATLTFNLHNRHTYSEEEARAGRAYVRYTATVGVLTPDNTLLARGVVQSEFRTAEDRLDRIGGRGGIVV